MKIEEPAAPASDDRAVVASRNVEIVVSLMLMALAAVLGWDNWRLGAGWASDGPQAGYFPF
jgi:putative tricarboxylic transport membrane protein